jgi:hypothetical protein
MRWVVVILGMLLTVGGCASRQKVEVQPLLPGGQPVQAVSAVCYPPTGWAPEPLKESSRHRHQIWLSPTGSTAYGVIHFSLPLPVGPEMVLRAFLREMQKQEGAADLLDKASDPALPGLRFEARGKLYHLWGNLMVSGWEGWAVYAGSRTGAPIMRSELELAATARESTRVGER